MQASTRVLVAGTALMLGALAFLGCPGGGVSPNGWLYPLGEYVDIGQRIFALQDGNYFIAGSGEDTQTIHFLSSAALVSSAGGLLWGGLFEGTYPGGWWRVSGSPVSDAAFVIAGKDNDDDFASDITELRAVKLDADGEVLWDRRYGRELIEPRDMAASGDGGCVIAGTRTFLTLQAANKAYTYTDRVFLRKLDVNGDIVWDRNYESPVQYNGLERIKPVSDGGYVMVGADAQIVRLDQEGNVLWWQPVGWTITLTGVSETSDGGFVAVGTAATNNPRPAVIRLDAAGNVLWTVYGADIVPLEQLDQYHVRDGVVDNEGRIVMVGQATTVRYVGNFFPIITNGGFVMQLDPNGNLLWNKSVSSAYEINGIALTNTGNYITTGTDGNHTQVLRIDTHGNVR